MKLSRATRFFRFLTNTRPRLLGGVASGPTRVNISAIPGGVVLHLDHHLYHALLELAEQCAEDPNGVVDQLTEIADLAAHARSDSDRAHERDQRVEELLEDIGGTHLCLYGDQVRRTAELLLAASGAGTVVTLPRQQDRRAA